MHKIKLLLFACLLPAPSIAARADTYEYRLIAEGNGITFGGVGLTDSGTVVYENVLINCGNPDGGCYYGNGSPSPTPPNLAYDNGVSCFAARERCSGAYSALVDEEHRNLIVDGPGGIQVIDGHSIFSTTGITDLLGLDALGDFIVCDCEHDTYVEGYDLSSREIPEPSSLLLLGTGIVGLFREVVRRMK